MATRKHIAMILELVVQLTSVEARSDGGSPRSSIDADVVEPRHVDKHTILPQETGTPRVSTGSNPDLHIGGRRISDCGDHIIHVVGLDNDLGVSVWFAAVPDNLASFSFVFGGSS